MVYGCGFIIKNIMRIWSEIVIMLMLLYSGCGKRVFFGNYLPFSTGYKWTFEDENGSLAEIEIFSDSLSGFRDTVFRVFFLGKNVDFVKTPNTLSWRLVKKAVIKDREVLLEDRYYPFFEMPFEDGKTNSIVYERRDIETGVYFRREYNYKYGFNEDEAMVDIHLNTLYVYDNDSIKENLQYLFYLVPDTGFKRIVYVENGKTHYFHLKEYRGE